MQNLKTIEQLLPQLTSENFESLQLLIQKQISQNRNSFEKAIQLGDTDNIEKLQDKVSFDSNYFKDLRKKTVAHVKSLHYFMKHPVTQKQFPILDSEIFETFHFLFKEALMLDSNFTNFRKKIIDQNNPLKFNASDILFASLFHRLKLNFEYSCEEPYPVYLFLKSLMQKDSKVWEKTVKIFCQYSLSKIDYQENSLLIQDLIKMDLTMVLFEQAKNEKNYRYIKSIIPRESIFNDDFMLKGLESYHYPMVKESFDNGVAFFRADETMSSEEKARYKNAFSNVFSSKESLEIQNLIINKISDISLGNHIIVKTILHKLEDSFETDIERNEVRFNFIQSIVERYNELDNDKIIEFKIILAKRKDSRAKDYLCKFINFHDLNNKLSSHSEVSIKRHKI